MTPQPVVKSEEPTSKQKPLIDYIMINHTLRKNVQEIGVIREIIATSIYYLVDGKAMQREWNKYIKVKTISNEKGIQEIIARCKTRTRLI